MEIMPERKRIGTISIFQRYRFRKNGKPKKNKFIIFAPIILSFSGNIDFNFVIKAFSQ